MNTKNLMLPIIAAIVVIVSAAAYIIFKLGQQSIYNEKWQDYDDYGWS